MNLHDHFITWANLIQKWQEILKEYFIDKSFIVLKESSVYVLSP